MTEEGKVKEGVKKIMKRYAPYVYYHMPVQNGMGLPTLDFVGCAGGHFFAIETKAPGKKPTPRQSLTAKQMCEAGGMTFVIDGSISDFDALSSWIEKVIGETAP